MAALIAVGIWWMSNTIAHVFIHRPFFRMRAANRFFAAALSALLGYPHTLWRERHLAHHGGVEPRVRVNRSLVVESLVVAAAWTTIARLDPHFFAAVYLPGYVGGLLLCWLHGHYEHVRGVTSHYGHVYNALCFNDGYHVEHHAHPARRWSELPRLRDATADASRWPAPLRWMEGFSLQALERLVLRSRLLERFVVRVHERAIRQLLAGAPSIRHIMIVGGGLFPRSALILRTLFPAARITIVDASRLNLDIARARLGDNRVAYVHRRYDAGHAGAQCDAEPADLLVIPLAFDGEVAAIYARPPAPAVLVHDWLWHRRGTTRVVSVALLKRVNLVTWPAAC
jgi:fatty acid desaturase